jgi:hypothetical protein
MFFLKFFTSSPNKIKIKTISIKVADLPARAVFVSLFSAFLLQNQSFLHLITNILFI